VNAVHKILSVISITRPVNFLISFFSIFVAGLICTGGEIKWMNILLASFAGAFIGSGGNIVNDIFDIEIDRINRPRRMLPSEKLSIKHAWILYFLFSAGGVILALFINASTFFIALISFIVIFFYSYSLKKIPLFGNVTVAFFTGLAFIFGGTAVNNWKKGIIPAVFAFLINLIRELIKDMEDKEGDAANGIITFPIKYGIGKTNLLITIFTILLIAVTTIPLWFAFYSIEYFIIVMLGVNVILVYFLKELHKADVNFRMMSNLLKLNMILGLIAIYAGSQY
jgi:geranylgeranylglycerol-phosphate geranylgeranyltransferase